MISVNVDGALVVYGHRQIEIIRWPIVVGVRDSVQPSVFTKPDATGSADMKYVVSFQASTGLQLSSSESEI